MCTIYINHMECHFPTIKFEDMAKYAADTCMQKALPHTTVFVAWRAQVPHWNLFLTQLESYLESFGSIINGRFFDSDVNGRMVMVCHTMDATAEEQLTFYFKRMCGTNWVIERPYFVAKELAAVKGGKR